MFPGGLERIYYRTRRWLPARVLYHPDYFRVLALLKKSSENEDFLKIVVTERIRSILSEAIAHVPFYRESVKLTLRDIKECKRPEELLQMFPYLDKETVMEQQDRFLNDRYRKKSIYYVTSGGSSGQGIGLWRDKRIADIEKAFFSWERKRFGFSLERSRYLRIGADARRKHDECPIWHQGNQLMLSPYHVNEYWHEEILSYLNKYRPEFINAYPSSLHELSRLIDRDNLHFHPKAIFLASEPVMDYQLDKIFKVFRASISFHYGLTERTNLAFAEYREGVKYPYKVNFLYGHTENRYVDGKFEIVGTSFWNEVMPLIRYCTADYGIINGNGEFTEIEGREQEFLLDKHENRIPGLSIVIDEKTWDFVKFYQVRQDSIGRIKILLVPRKGKLSMQQLKYVLDAQKIRWGGFFDISVHEVEDIPLTISGKRRLVVSSMNKNDKIYA